MNIHSRAVAAEIIFIRKIGHSMFRPRPAENPLRFVRAHVDTAMTHRRAKVLVPVGAVKGVADFRKKAGVWNAR